MRHFAMILLLVFPIPRCLASTLIEPLEQVAVLVEKDPVTGTTSASCAKDGKCNIGACNNDPDCPAIPDVDPSATVRPAANVQSTCGGTVAVLASDSPLGSSATTIARKYANFNVAQKAKNPSFFDSHPSGVLATGHAELKGFGVTMIQGKWPKPVDDASGSLSDPTLLFFRKSGKDQDNWTIIGMGYTFEFDTNNQGPPTAIAGIGANDWWIHEAGYHHSPGNGGFTCATTSNLKRSVQKAGKTIDSAGCQRIVKSDINTREFHADQKHGRYWTVHVWFEPSTRRPTLAKTDPWCRQSSDALVLPGCTFLKQGQCP